jgi:hypothetical protein
VSDLSGSPRENKRPARADLGHVARLTLPRVAFREGSETRPRDPWTTPDDRPIWGVDPVFVPHSVRGHEGKFRKHTALKCEDLYRDRDRLDRDLRTPDGVVLRRAMPHTLRRMGKTHGKGRGPKGGPAKLPPWQIRANQEKADHHPYERRRGDVMLAVARLVGVYADCSGYEDGFLCRQGQRGSPMSLEEMAERAGIAEWTAKRADRTLRFWGYVTFNKRNVKQLADGSWVSVEASYRRFDWPRWIEDFGGKGSLYGQAFEAARKRSKAQAAAREKEEERAPSPPPSDDPRAAWNAVVYATSANMGKGATVTAPPPGTPYDALPDAQRARLRDAIASEHPTWRFPEIIAEARRRALAPPNVPGAAEPETSERADD